MKKYLFALIAVTAAVSSCKKDKNETLQDKVYAYAQEAYLWYDALPAYNDFNPRQYSGNTERAALQAEIDAFSQIKINPSTGKAYEYDASFPGTAKYSYIDEGQAATAIGGTGGDFGFNVTYVTSTDLRIRYVFPGSSAATQNLARGYKVLAVNDSPVALTSGGSTDPAVVKINQALASNSIKLNLERPDGTTFTTTVTRGSYTINPVIKASIITTSTGKKVGYFAFSRFTVLTNAQAEIDKAFALFSAGNITELVVDLRYNGGGSVSTSQYLANYMVPASKNNTLMFTEVYNNKLQNGNHPLLSEAFTINSGQFSLAKNTFNFAKKGTLNLNQVFFLVTGSTASASELLINNLKPVLPNAVKLIGKTTYGKPVGFFGIDLDKYDLYLSEFESRNADNKADFYQGMIPGDNFAGFIANDDVTRDFGDPAENLLSRALSFVDKGTYTINGYKTQSVNADADEALLRNANRSLDSKQQFSGAVNEANLKQMH